MSFPRNEVEYPTTYQSSRIRLGATMTAGSYNTFIKQGRTFRRTITFTAGGSPVNLTGGSVSMDLKKQLNATATAYSFTTYITVPTPTNGIAILNVPAAFTATMDLGRYVYDVKLIDSTGRVLDMLEGFIEVRKAVTS
jgi:hypothetical protein